MKKSFILYWIFSLMGVLAASSYPLYMGFRVVSDMITDGTVMAENYPKYIIPYTPISLAVIIGVLLLPVFLKIAKKLALLAGSAVSIGVFFLSELLLESKVIVTETVETTLESWQMYMCAVYIPQETYEERTKTAVDMMMGDYSPMFKLHFYIISVVLILAFLNCFYGFGRMVQSGDKKRLKPLIMQAVSSVLFLGMCLVACFTAFGRDGNIQVSSMTAVLMSTFFVLFGVTMGLFAGSLLYGRNRGLSVVLPTVTASAVTIVMYIGEMILLSGNLYRFGEGVFFSGLGVLVLAPADIAVILGAGLVTAVILLPMQKKENNNIKRAG